MTRTAARGRSGSKTVRSTCMTAVWIVSLAASADAATITVSNTNSSGAGSLAQAITTANATVTADVIEFSSISLATQTIAGPFPPITQPLTINGYSVFFSSPNGRTDETSNANILIELDGQDAGGTILTINSSDVTIKGLALRGISDTGRGIFVAPGESNVSILGSFIGTAANGTTDDSQGIGILVDGTARIGSALAADRNLISGNQIGIELQGTGSVIENNLIGPDSDGGVGIGNDYGIFLSDGAGDNIIGGASSPNHIAANHRNGIELTPDAGDGNRLFHNRFHDNGALAIDLRGDGPTFNDEDDSDSGPNGLLNSPELDFVRVNQDELKVRGTVRSKPGQYWVHLFGSAEADSNGFGDGTRKYATPSATVAPGETAATFEILVPGIDGDDPRYLAAVLEEVATGNTSEFSRTIEALDGGNEFVVTNTSDEYVVGSIRAALSTASEGPEPNTIVFDIPGNGPHTFTAETLLLLVGGGTTIIDGYSQPGSLPNTAFEGSNATPKIVFRSGTAATQMVMSIDGGADLTLQGVVIQGGKGEGIRFTHSTGRLLGNFIGTDATGTSDVGNAESGIRVAGTQPVTIGGPTPAQRNVISGNHGDGINDAGSETTVINNLIGYGANFDPFGNAGSGINTKAATVIGGDDPDLQNRIGHNDGPGVYVQGASSRVDIRGNSIVDNDGLGIDLWSEGEAINTVTPNDVDDLDAGANDLQNFPVITAVEVSPSSFVVEGTLDVGDPEDRFMLRVYASSGCDASGYGEGERFLGVFERDFVGGETFELAVPATLLPGEKVTMTASTGMGGETSEFSPCFGIPGGVVCGDASGDEEVSATDALFVLRTAVGTRTCDLCLCDVNESGSVNASDALLTLRLAVGQSVSLVCPDC